VGGVIKKRKMKKKTEKMDSRLHGNDEERGGNDKRGGFKGILLILNGGPAGRSTAKNSLGRDCV
jgi:hypothetical protein